MVTLKKLKELRVDHNKLATLPELPASVVTLKADHNVLLEVPAQVFQLPSLVAVDFSHNQITQISGFEEAEVRVDAFVVISYKLSFQCVANVCFRNTVVVGAAQDTNDGF